MGGHGLSVELPGQRCGLHLGQGLSARAVFVAAPAPLVEEVALLAQQLCLRGVSRAWRMMILSRIGVRLRHPGAFERGYSVVVNPGRRFCFG